MGRTIRKGFVPDFVNFKEGYVAESKNIGDATLNFTPQLKAEYQFAVDNKLRFDLYVSQNTKIVGADLKQLIAEGKVNLIRFFP